MSGHLAWNVATIILAMVATSEFIVSNDLGEHKPKPEKIQKVKAELKEKSKDVFPKRKGMRVS